MKLIIFMLVLLSCFATYQKADWKTPYLKDKDYVERVMSPFKVNHKDRIRDCILNYSRKYNLDPRLVTRLIKKESGFRRRAVNHNRTAYGLTQVKPEFWSHKIWYCRDRKMGKYLRGLTNEINHSEYLFWVGISVEVGCMILRDHLREFGSIQLSLVSYNMGRNSPEFRECLKDPEKALEYSYVIEIMDI